MGADPSRPHRAAAALGRLVAQGLLGADECLPHLVVAAAREAPALDLAGLRARLAHRLQDSACHWRLRRGKAEAEIRVALAPLLAAWASAAELGAAARAVNARLRHPLRAAEVDMLTRAQAAAWLRAGRHR